LFDRIVTHDDFDGLVSAALVGYFLEIEKVVFAGPGEITNSRVSTGATDIVCDLPYPLECGMWFDHHEANLEDLALRGIDQETIPGLRKPAPSCARVILEYYETDYEIDKELVEIVEASDRIDSFAYGSIEDWRRLRPENEIDAAIKLKAGKPAERKEFMRWLVLCLMDESLEAVAGKNDVIERAGLFRAGEEQMLKIIEQHLEYLGDEREIILLDFSGHTRRVNVIRNLAQLLATQALAVLEINSLFHRQVKTNDLTFSMSLTIAGAHGPARRDLGEIMRALNIGSGHAGAASGILRSRSKPEMLKAKQSTLNVILEQWKKQGK
jgi:oligoribonuclease NrnB/cAMP/cGMP phosphodiesterase (DHH superfamily)